MNYEPFLKRTFSPILLITGFLLAAYSASAQEAVVRGEIVSGNFQNPGSTFVYRVYTAFNPTGLAPVSSNFRLRWDSDAVTPDQQFDSGDLGSITEGPVEIETNPGLPDRFQDFIVAPRFSSTDLLPIYTEITFTVENTVSLPYPIFIQADPNSSGPLLADSQTRIPHRYDNSLTAAIGNPTPTPSPTPSPTPTQSPTPSASPSPSPTPSQSPTASATPSATPTETPLPTVSATATPSPTSTPSPTATATVSPTSTPPTVSPTASPAPSMTPTPDPTPTATPSATGTPTASPSMTPTPSSSPTPSATPTTMPTATATPTPTPSPTLRIVPTIDSDYDGLFDDNERLDFNTNPENKDTDGDGFEDGVEVLTGSDPTEESSPGPGNDIDMDGLPDNVDPDPTTADADGDRILDFYEVLRGTDPADDSEFPLIGDINDDGTVNNVDAVIAFNYFLGNLPEDFTINLENGDINRDGRVEYTDSITIFNFFLEVVPTLPI